MRSSGAAPAIFGACLASAAIRCSCFTVNPRLVLSRPGGRASSVSVRLAATPPSSSATSDRDDGGFGRMSNLDRAPPFSAAPSSHSTTRRQRQKARRRTRLSSTKETTSRTNTTSSGSSSHNSSTSRAHLTTSQQLRAEVAARWPSGARFPPPPSELDDDCVHHASEGHRGLPDSRGATIDEQEEALRLEMRSSSFSASAAAAEHQWGQASSSTGTSSSSSSSNVSGYYTTSGYVEAESTDVERRRLLDRTHPPAELLTKFEEQPSAVASSGSTSTSGDGGMGLWASRGLLAGAAMLYGTNFGCVKLLEETVPMSLAAALRFSIAMVPFLPFLRKINPGVFRAGAEVGVLNAIGYWAQSQSLMTTTASKSAFICSLAVILVPLLDAYVSTTKKGPAVEEKKKANGGVLAALNGPWLPAILAAMGVACLELIGVEGGPNSGDLWAMGQPLCFGMGFWLTERSSRKYPGDIFGLVAAQLLTVAVLAVGWCIQAGELPLSLESLHETVLPSSGSLAVPLSLMWTGLVTTSLTVFGESVAMKQISAAESTIILSTEPIWGTAFAAVLLGETIGWNTGLGALLIVSACTWSSVGPALQVKLLSLIAATGAAGTVVESGIVDVDELTETVGMVIKDLVKDQIEL